MDFLRNFGKITAYFKRVKAFCLEKDISPARFLRIVFGLFAGFMLLWGLVVIFIDPYVVWHRAVGLKQVYAEPYAMIPGVLRHFDYDTVLVGSSLTKNTRISDVDTLLGVHAVKATASGAQGEDCRQFMQEAIAAGKVRRIVLGTDIWNFLRQEDTPHWSRYRYLYGKRNVLPYLFTMDTAEQIGEVLKNHCFADAEDRELERDFDRMFFDNVGRYRYCRTTLEASVREDDVAPPRAQAECPAERVEEYVFAVAKAHPEIRFDLFFAPYSTYFWCAVSEQQDLEAYLNVRTLIAKEAATLPNVYLHDLQAAEKIVDNLENYKDITHYSPAVNRWIVEQIAASPEGDSPETVAANNAIIRRLASRRLDEFLKLRQTGEGR